MSLLRKKTIEQSIADTDEPEYQLKKRLTALDLTVFGIGVIIGAADLHPHRPGRAGLRRSQHRAVVRARRYLLRAGRALLRGVLLDRAGLRLGVHVLLLLPR